MDITTHLTDKQRERSAPSSLFEPGDFERAYLNADSDGNIAEFSYSFKLQDSTLEYQYGKTDEDTVIYETLFINGQKIVAYNRQEQASLEINLAGTETLNKDLDQIHISVLKYIKSNAVLTSSTESSVLAVFFKFIDNMLFFWQTMRRGYMGYTTGSDTIWTSIIVNNHFDDFKLFLKNAGFDSNIAYEKIDSNQYRVYFQFENYKPNFWNNASSGLQSISVFYYWLQMMKYETKPPSFVFIDEFDAFYHEELSEFIIKELKKLDACQIILTTHDTSVMTNELMRPDCLFLMHKNSIRSAADSTERELRFEHNIEKMYRAGVFHG
jgi:hypothetical protein